MSKIFIVLASFIFFVHCTVQESKLLQSLDEQAANNIVLVLSNNKVSATKKMDKDGTFYIVVPDSKKQIEALQVLSNFGEPQTKHVSMGEVFKKDGLISSPVEEFARYTYALDQEIETTLAQIDGIITVKVQVSMPMPSDNLWSAEAVKPGAAIFIKYRPGYRIDLLTNRIKLLVSKAVPGLTPEMVEVLPVAKKEN